MNASLFFDWLLRTSWQASILVLLIFAAQWVFRRQLSARWQYALWLLVVARLAMPSLPASSWSVFNVVHYTAKTTTAPPRVSDLGQAITHGPAAGLVAKAPLNFERVDRAQIELQSPVAPAMFDKQHLMRNAEIIWILGLLLLGGRAIGQNIAFVCRLRNARPVRESEALALFDRCKEIMGVTTAVPFAETDHVKSPALYGFFRPTLLLPAKVMDQFTAAEQRHIFLHELAHVKRRDMAVHWAATVFRLLHWFNPVLWYGFQRMAADRELACDELALGRAGADEARPYGETVLKLLEICARPAVLPGLMGILEEKSQMTRRILRIARYKQKAGWPILALLLLAGLGLVTLTDAQIEKSKTTPAPAASTSRPNLIGDVHLTSGEPVTATVFISTASPKTGTSTFCPSCYADCIKSGKADAQGHFRIESLDPTLLFRILVVARDCAPQYVKKVDPAKGPVTVELERRSNADSPPGNTLRGRVVDTNGVPIVGAAVEAFGIRQKDGSGRWGALEGVDPLAVTDDKGEFLITSLKPFAALDVKVEARGFANKTFTELRGGSTRHDLTMTEGALVSGRVTWNGKPLGGVSVGIVSADRSAESFAGNYEVGTDAGGRFAFLNLPPNVQYNLYGIMQTMHDFGATTPVLVATGGDGAKTDAGELVVGVAHRIAGRVVLDDGKPIPPGTRLMIGREDAWDSLHIELDKDGRFDAAGIASGVVSMSLRVPGYRLSAKNGSLDRLNFRLVGRTDADITNMTILLEKGAEIRPDLNNFSMENRPDDRPLRGMEDGPVKEEMRVQSWTISGRVTDASTGQPLPAFLVTPGVKQFQKFIFDGYGEFRGTNGVYAGNVSKRLSEPYLKVEADGYLPIATSLPLGNTTDFDIKLKKGTGPSGIVLLPDGKPAANATVGLVCAGKQGMRIGGDGALLGPGLNKLLGATGNDGNFSFMPTVDMINVAASSAAGFKLVSVAELESNSRIVLEPWGRVTGTLQCPSGPGTNEDLTLSWSRETMTFPAGLQTGCRASTDDQGRFEFDRVPPGKLTVFRSVRLNEHAFNMVPLQDIMVSPGKILDVKIDAPERATSGVEFGGFSQSKPLRARGPAISGTVDLPGGKPAGGVEVALIVPNEYIALGKGTLKTSQVSSLRSLTDGAGHFTLPGVEGATGIVAAAETGFARIALSGTNAHILTLQPWGEIHGTLRVGRRLGANQSVLLTGELSDGLNYDNSEFKSLSDDQGRFVITYAPPGEQRLLRLIPMGDGSFYYGLATVVSVKAGEVTDVTIGGKGHEVIGEAKFQDGQDALGWKEVRFSLQPQASNNLAWKTPPFPAESATNGSFVFEDVLPGNYELSAAGPRYRNGQILISNRYRNWQILGGKEVTIPDAGSGGDAKPIDVGTLNLRTVRSLNVGDAATPIEVETSEGRKLQLADFHGKFVLLNVLFEGFELPSDLPQVKQAFETYGKDDRFAVLSVTYAPPNRLNEFARTNGITWTHGSLGNRYTHSEFEDYLPFPPDVNHSQLSYLIDPEGKIVAKDLHGAAITEAVAKALARK